MRDREGFTTRRLLAASTRSRITFFKRNWLPLGVLFGLLFILGDIGIGKVYLGLDAAGHYVRVWFIHEELFSTGLLPFTNTSLEGGRAIAYPYGFLPYSVTAVLFHFLNDRAVTFMMVAGVVALVTVASLTKFRNDLVLVAAFVAFIPFIEGLLSFQFVFFWAATFFFCTYGPWNSCAWCWGLSSCLQRSVPTRCWEPRQ